MGLQARRALRAEAAPPLADGTILYLQALGNGDEGFALLMALDDLLALREGECTRHDITSGNDPSQTPKNGAADPSLES
jgi:hypothetical protein